MTDYYREYIEDIYQEYKNIVPANIKFRLERLRNAVIEGKINPRDAVRGYWEDSDDGDIFEMQDLTETQEINLSEMQDLNISGESSSSKHINYEGETIDEILEDYQDLQYCAEYDNELLDLDSEPQILEIPEAFISHMAENYNEDSRDEFEHVRNAILLQFREKFEEEAKELVRMQTYLGRLEYESYSAIGQLSGNIYDTLQLIDNVHASEYGLEEYTTEELEQIVRENMTSIREQFEVHYQKFGELEGIEDEIKEEITKRKTVHEYYGRYDLILDPTNFRHIVKEIMQDFVDLGEYSISPNAVECLQHVSEDYLSEHIRNRSNMGDKLPRLPHY